MQKKSRTATKYKVASICFVLGVLTLLIPYPLREEVLPETGVEPELEVELTVDKSDVQRDDPAEGAQVVNYTVRVKNNAECVQTSVNVMLTHDKSGSMLSLMNDAKQAGITFVQNLDFSKDLAGIAAYDDNAHLLLGLSSSEADLISTINSLSAGGMTNIGDGIDVAKDGLLAASNFSEATSVMIIFTDGRANRPRGVDPRQYAIDQATEAKNAGVRIISVAYGSYADQDLMREIASGPGDYHFAPSGSDMVAIYTAISESLQGNSPDMQVTIDLSQVENIVDLESISAGGIHTLGQLQWDFGTMECQVAMFGEFSLRVNNNAQDLNIIDLIAIASNSAGDVAQSLNAVTTVHAPAFNLSKTDHKDEALPGETLDYEIVVENVGTGNGYGIVITDTLPSEYFAVIPRSMSDNGEYNNSERTITWDNDGEGYILDGSFEPTGSSWGSSKTVTFSGVVVRDLDPGLYTLLNTVLLETSKGFSQQAQDETDIPYGPDLSITKESDPPLYTYPGGEVTYTLTIRNNGNVAASGVVVTDDYDQNYLSVDPENGYVQDGTIIWYVGVLGIDEERTLIYNAGINDYSGGNTVTIPNEAIVTLNEPDINESDNIAVHEIIATLDPVLTISKTSDRTTYEMDEEIEYTVVITNNSSANAYNVVLADVIPYEFDYVTGSTMVEGISYSNPDGTHDLSWNLNYLASGESITLTFRAIPNSNCSEGNYQAIATVVWEDEEGNTFDPVSADCVVSIVEEQDVVDGDIGDIEDGGIVDLTGESLEGLIQMAQSTLLSNLAKAGTVIYLKVLFGVGLALPLPLMLIFGEKEKDEKLKEKERKGKKGRKKTRSKGRKRRTKTKS